MNISVVIPVFDSEHSLRPLVARLHPVLSDAAEQFELILVNDQSRDGSWGVIRALSAEHSWIRGINLMRNVGQHNALLCGIRQARFETTLTIDDDLQHPPEEIPKLLAKLAEGCDVVYGTPKVQRHGLLRDLASAITKMALRSAMHIKVASSVSAFRVFRTHLRKAFRNYHGPYVSIDVLLTWGTTNFAAVTVNHEPRTIGVSNYTLRKLITHAFNMMTGFSTVPLQLSIVLGFLMTALGVTVLFLGTCRYIFSGEVVTGFTFLCSLLSVFSGSQLFALGIIGEYLARMHFRLMDRPQYVVAPESEPELSDDEHAPAGH